MPLNTNDNFDETLLLVNKKISEIKKKIQLSEGQRKAHFEECDAEKKKNNEKISSLKKEIKDLYKRLSKPQNCDESVVKSFTKYPKDVGALRNQRIEEAVLFFDYKCIDLNKKLDVLQYQNRKRQRDLKKLADEHKKLVTEMSNDSRRIETVRTKPICLLENQIHRVEMNLMEAEHVNKKYRTIRTYLQSDRVEFECSLRKLEHSIQVQENEIKHLEKVNKEALNLRDVTKGTLLRQEMSALNAGKNRDHQLQCFRQRVEERKIELETLERRMFPPGRSIVHQDSLTLDPAQLGALDRISQQKTNLETSFGKLKIATGENDPDEVLKRFLYQKETRTRLLYLKTAAEEDKKKLEGGRERNLAELEAYKFAEVKDREQSQEEVEKMNNTIEEQCNLQKTYEHDEQRIREQLNLIHQNICEFIDKFFLASTEISQFEKDSDCVKCIVYLQNLIKHKVSLISATKSAKTMVNVANEEGSLFLRFSPADEGMKQVSKGPQLSLLIKDDEDEDDIPSRAFIKRQAQLIVDAKSRRKFNRSITFQRPHK